MSDLETIYFIHHSHTDIGYTHDQPIVWDLNDRFLDQVIDLAERGLDQPDDAAFRWTVESTAMLWHWLQTASSRQVDRFAALEKAGLMEVTAMLANLTPLFDTDQLIESFQVIRHLRNDYGFNIHYAMNCDVNGHNWPLVDLLLDLDIHGFSMAVNPHYGSAPFQRPSAFWWQGPSRREILTWNGWLYIFGWRFGIGQMEGDTFGSTWLPLIEAYLKSINYPYKALMIQSAHPFGDNAGGFYGFSEFIRRWNAEGRKPYLKFATPATWFKALETEGDSIPHHRGDWTDYWNFGCISSSREQAVNRANRTRLQTADALAAINLSGNVASPQADQPQRSMDRHRASAWHHLFFWDEHTWGADQAIHQPYLDDTLSQWNHKAHNAYRARSLSLLMQRDGLAALSHCVQRGPDDKFLLFNPLPYKRVIAGDVTAGTLSERFLDWETIASRHYQDRLVDLDSLSLWMAREQDNLNINAVIADILLIKPVEVPAFGYRTISTDDLVTLDDSLRTSQVTEVENHRHKLVFDMERGGIRSWYDKALDCEWVNPESSHRFFGYVHETVGDHDHPLPRTLMFEEGWNAQSVDFPDGWRSDWPAERTLPDGVIHNAVYETAVGTFVIQHVSHPAHETPLVLRVFLPHYDDFVDFKASWIMGLNARPEATYLTFPVALEDAVARLDLGGQSMVVCDDQLPGVCRDYFTVQKWTDFNDGERGMSIASPGNPMVQLGDFHFGGRQSKVILEEALFLGWVTNNYWGTNFRANQPGEVRAHYRLQPYAGAFDEAQAHRFGEEAMHHLPLMQTLGEPLEATPDYPTSGSLIDFEIDENGNTPVRLLHVKQAQAGNGIIVRLINASDVEQSTTIRSRLMQITQAHHCSLLEEIKDALPLDNGTVTISFKPRQVVTVLLRVE